MKELSIELYKKVFLIRTAEEKICEHYMEDEMKTPVHLSVGQEAISAGVCAALGDDDGQVLGTYRSHGIYLARTGESDKFFAELYGKATGVAQGVAGSMHLSAPDQGFLGTSAIVGSIIPVASGAAFANKMQGNGKTVAVFFGDGAIDEGAFWETMNAACLMKLPMIFVCEDNDLAVHTTKSMRHGYKSITDVVSQFECNVLDAETTDVEEIYNLTLKAVELYKENGKPCFMHLKYYRYREHVGVFEDFDSGYRSREEFEKWNEIDPITTQRQRIIDDRGVSEEQV